MSETGSTTSTRADQIIKLLSAFCFLAIALSIVAAHDAPAAGYEVSIYNSTPLIFWVVIVGSTIWGLLVVLQQIYSGGHKLNNTWMAGFSVVFLSYTAILALYLIRGYGFFNLNGDAATHIGIIKRVLSEGVLPSSVIYPITHVYTAGAIMISHIDLTFIYTFIPLAFYILYIPIFYLLAKEILPEKGQAMIATTLSCAFLTGVLPFSSDHLFFIPNMVANAIFPVWILALFKYLRTASLSWGLALYALILLFIPFHPITAIALMVIISTIPLGLFAYRYLIKKSSAGTRSIIATSAVIFLIILVWFVIWVSNYWTGTVQSLLRYILYGGASYLTLLNNDASSASIYGYGIVNVVSQILKMMGGAFAFVLLSVLCLPIIWKELRKNSQVLQILTLYGPIVFLGIVMVILYVSNISFGPLRFIEYISIFTTIIVAYLVYYFIIRSRGSKNFLNKAALLGITGALIIVFINGIFVVYPSSYTLNLNEQTSQHELKGIGWFLDNGDMNGSTTSMNLILYRYAHYLLTPEEQKAWRLPIDAPPELIIPYHFNYDQSSTLAEYFPHNTSIVTSLRDESIYTDIYPQMAKYRFSPQDFQNLSADRSIEKVYTNDEMDIWYVFHPGAYMGG